MDEVCRFQNIIIFQIFRCYIEFKNNIVYIAANVIIIIFNLFTIRYIFRWKEFVYFTNKNYFREKTHRPRDTFRF